MGARALGATLAFVLLLSGCAESPRAGVPAPNFVVFLVDDQGWSGTSVELHPDEPASRRDDYRTPHLEALAERGVRFSRAYAAAPTCSPSRASLLTGTSPAALRFTVAIDHEGNAQNPSSPTFPLDPAASASGLPAEATTLPELLKAARPEYVTAHLGKWHLAGGGPGKHGFDVYDPERVRRGRVTEDNPKDIFGITSRAIAFMESQVEEDRPFYLQLSHFAVHWKPKALASTLEAVRGRNLGLSGAALAHAAMTEDLDVGLGRIVEALDALGIRESTYVIYLSDNGGALRGGATGNAPLRSGKGTLYEGGLRVPMVIAGPGVPGGGYTQEPVIGWDVLPTVLDLAGASDVVPATVEGGSLRALLEGENARSNRVRIDRVRDGLAWHLPHYSEKRAQTPVSTFLLGRWKLFKKYETGELELYDLASDPSEADDRARDHPERVADLARRLDTWLSEIGAALPTRRRAHRPSRAPRIAGSPTG